MLTILNRRHPFGTPATLSLATTAALCATQTIAQVQQQDQPLETVLVTAVRSQAVTLFDSLDLKKDRGTTGVEEALRRAPNINVLGTQNGFINIRGENAEGAGNSAFGIIPGRLIPTPVTIDRRPLAYGEITFGTSSVYDIDYLEVVRGPQTTGGGINGAMGAVNVVTKDPTESTEAEAQIEFGTFSQRQVSGLVSGEIVSGELFGRLVVDYNERDTYLNYTQPTALNPDQNTFFDQTTVRAKAVWLPSSSEDLRIEAAYTYSESAGPQTENVTDGPNTGFERSSGNVASFFNEGDAATLELDYEFSDTLSLNNHFAASRSDLKRRSGNGTFSLDQETEDFQNETSLSYRSSDGVFEFTPGVIIRTQSIDMDWDYFGPTLLDDDRDSLGIYGEGSYKLADSLSLTAGLRYQYESQRRVGVLANDPSSNPTPVDYDESFDELLPRLGLTYDANDQVTVGAFVARGFTPGGFSFARPTADNGRGDGVTPFSLPEFDEETRLIYEAFLRSQFLDDRLEVFVNAFYNEIDDVQLVERVEIGDDLFASVIANGEQAVTYGMEVAANFLISPALEVNGSLGVLETEITDFAAAPDVEGNELERAPGVTASFGIDFEPIDGLSFGASVAYTAGYFSGFDNAPLEETDARTLVDLRASYRVNSNVEVYGVANNLFDETALTSKFRNGLSGATIKPQEFVLGVQVGF